MARQKKTRVFVSYSRHDEPLVKPLAAMLGAAANEAVFLDVTSISPGDFWKSKIDRALSEASVFILCWCCDSSQSEFVAYEITKALQHREKKLVPVLFCDTPLPFSLQSIQWIDLKGKVVHECRHGERYRDRENTGLFGFSDVVPIDLGDLDVANPAPEMNTSGSIEKQLSTRWVVAFVAAVFFVIIIWSSIRSNKMSAPIGNASPEPVTLPLFAIIGAAIILAVSTELLYKWLRRRTEHHRAENLAATAKEYFENLASEGPKPFTNASS